MLGMETTASVAGSLRLLLKSPRASRVPFAAGFGRCRCSLAKPCTHSGLGRATLLGRILNAAPSSLQPLQCRGLFSRRMHLLSGIPAAALVLMAANAQAEENSGTITSPVTPAEAGLPPTLGTTGYALPPPEILAIVDRPTNPALSFSPNRDSVLFLERPSMPPIVDLARPELKLAGVRIDPEAYTRSKMSSYLGISIHKLQDDDTLAPSPLQVHGLPPGSRINFVSWSPDAKHLAFTVRQDGDNSVSGASVAEARRLSLWVADLETGKARQLLGHPEFFLNTVFDTYTWLDDSTLVALVRSWDSAPAPARPLAPSGPTISDNTAGEVAQARTFTDLLKDQHDADLFEHYTTTQLLKVSLDGSTHALGPLRMYSAVEASNDGRYLLVTEIKRPFSLEFPCGRFPCAVHVLRADTGEIVQTVADVPLADKIPITFNSCRAGRRGISWRPDCLSTLYWVEAQDQGNAKIDASPRDIVYTFPGDPAPGEQPQVLHTVDMRYGGVTWGDKHFALAYESWHQTRRSRVWGFNSSPGSDSTREQDNNGAGISSVSSTPTSAAATAPASVSGLSESDSDCSGSLTCQPLPQLIFDRSYEDRYSDPGSPMARRTSMGTYLLAEVEVDADKKGGDSGTDAGTSAGKGLRLLLNGSGATPEGNIPFIDLFNVNTGEKTRIWSSDAQKYFESVSSILSDTKDGPIPLSQLKVLLTRESKDEPAQYFIKRFRDGSEVQLTDFPHPYPSLRGVQKEIIKYTRKDGVQLTGTLYLPPGYEAGRDGPLPLLMWAYPREYKSKDAAGQVSGSPNSFPGIGASSPLLFLSRGYAVLSGPSMPIIGEGDAEANDSFVEQLVASAEAAVDEVVRRGVASRDKIAIGGHSYGAFMSANLAAHAPGLFCCIIAQSGAYNRTLTPFSFQQEERSLWQARDVYLTMSPFLMADKIKTPVLLIHGAEDQNAGTYPMQTERFFQALKGHGATVRMVLLPHEGHGYRARESLLHVLAEQSAWLDQFCKGRSRGEEGQAADSATGREELVSKL